MVKWLEWRMLIPHRLKIKDHYYEVVWVDDFADGNTLGEARPTPRQIVLKTNQSARETVHTFLHECAHAFDFEYDIGLTEAQVLKIEKCLYYVLKPGNIFKQRG